MNAVRIANRSLLLTALLLTASSVAWAQVYRVVDENGNVTYTDQAPGPDAKPITLRELSVISPQVPDKPAPSAETVAAAEAAAEGQQEVTNIGELRRGYRDFRIVSPEPDQQFVGTGNMATVAWDTQYRLQPGMMVTFYIDGEPQAPTTAQSMNIGPMDRGTHEVYAELRDSRNRQIAVTDPVSFHIFQWSVNFGNRQNQGN